MRGNHLVDTRTEQLQSRTGSRCAYLFCSFRILVVAQFRTPVRRKGSSDLMALVGVLEQQHALHVKSISTGALQAPRAPSAQSTFIACLLLVAAWSASSGVEDVVWTRSPSSHHIARSGVTAHFSSPSIKTSLQVHLQHIFGFLFPNRSAEATASVYP